MEQKHQCGNCGDFDLFYTKAYCKFLRHEYGYCSKTHEVKVKTEACDCWRRQYGRRRSNKNPLIVRALESSLTDIAVLRQIFTEDNEKE